MVLSSINQAVAVQAQPISVGAYAVSDHSNCQAGDLPGTIKELERFFESPNLPQEFQQNFFWKDERVKQSEWAKEGDFVMSSESLTGFDGADASVISYIASHGVTSKGTYRALTGTQKNGGCYISNKTMELGNNVARYAILSTCQGLKIGDGDNPSRVGENPSLTWKSGAAGMNCILGYSNNMADDDTYGEYLLANLKDGNTSISKAFMDASDAVSPDNIPAVLCFGETEEDAALYLQENKIFETESRPQTKSAWMYRKTKSIEDRKALMHPTARSLKLSPMSINHHKLASAFLGSNFTQAKSETNSTYNSELGLVDYNHSTGTVTIKNFLIPEIRDISVPSREESQEIAVKALLQGGFMQLDRSLTLAAVSEDVLGGSLGLSKVQSRKFTFRQKIAGAMTVSQQGSIDVTIGTGGVVTEIKAALVTASGAEATTTTAKDLDQRTADLESQAIELVAAKSPGANYRVLKSILGYDAGDFLKRNPTAKAVMAVTVEVQKGDFKRNFIEKIAL